MFIWGTNDKGDWKNTIALKDFTDINYKTLKQLSVIEIYKTEVCVKGNKTEWSILYTSNT